jgi:hypothetical protein
MKKCRLCCKHLSEDHFNESNLTSDGLSTGCLSCNEKKARQAREKYANDPEVRKKKKEYDDKNSEDKGFLEKKARQARKKYANDPEVRKRVSDYHLNKYRTDPHYAVDHNISSQIRQSLKYGKEGQSWESLVGYSLEELTDHLESLFVAGMSWENYGEWHIDHRTPRSWFAYEDVNDPAFRECWSLKNLQPKWAKENIRKGNRYVD